MSVLKPPDRDIHVTNKVADQHIQIRDHDVLKAAFLKSMDTWRLCYLRSEFRSVLIVDQGMPCNFHGSHMHPLFVRVVSSRGVQVYYGRIIANVS